MQNFTKLPTAAKVAIPAILLALVLALAMMSTSGPRMTEVFTTKDADLKAATEWKLDVEKIKSSTELKDGRYHINVRDVDAARAGAAIEGSSLTSRLSQDSSDKCKEPGSFSTQAQQARFKDCVSEQKVRDALVRQAGVLQAAVTVVTEDSGELIGSSKESRVTAQLFLDPSASEPLNASFLAAEVANMVPGGSTGNVILKDANGKMLWGQGNGVGAGGPGAGSLASCLGQGEGTVDITTMEQRVSACYEADIRQTVAAIIGSEDHVQVAVRTTLNPSMQSVSSTTVTNGTSVARTSDSSSGNGSSSTSEQETIQPGLRKVDSTTIAGAIQRMAISVTLDSKFSDAKKEKAVSSILNAYVDPRRGDSPPSVISVPFGALASSKDGADGAANGGAASATAPDGSANEALQPASSFPTTLVAIAGIIIAALFAGLLMMWQRARTESTRRQAVEQEFAREQSMFGAFAQQNPDDLADELNRLLGAPGPGVGAGR